MYSLLSAWLALIIGGYTQEIITNEHKAMVDAIKPQFDTLAHKKGFNGLFPEGQIMEVVMQTVNGRNYWIRVIDNTCLHIYQALDGALKLTNVLECKSISDVIA